MKKRKILALTLSLCLILNGAFVIEGSAAETGGGSSVDASATDASATDVSATDASQPEALSDENQYRELSTMDEEGNITEAEDFDGAFSESETVNPNMKAKARSAKASAYVVNFNTKSNATTSYTDAFTGESGYTNGDYGADAAYLGTSNGKVKFMMSGVTGWVKSSDVQVIPVSSAKVISGYEVSNGRLIHGIVCDMTTPGYRTTLDNGAAPSYLKTGVKYYSYDGHYFYTDYATMLSDYQSNTRKNSVNPQDPYYNYYQYLPMRTSTSYSSSTFNSMINSKTSSSSKMYNTGSSFVTNQNTYGVNALLMSGIAANESAWGTSWIATNKNNLFGLNAVDSSPGTSASTFASVAVCIKDFANGWMSRGYINPKDWRYFGGFLGNKASGLNVKYASDPFWGEKAANVAYSIDKAGGSKDYNKYTIGINDHRYVNVREDASTASGSSVFYSTGGSTSYSVVLLNSDTKNSFYKIQSDAVLNSSRTGVSSSGNYSFDNMYAYIYSDYVEPVNSGTTTPEDPEPEPVTLSSIKITTPPSRTAYTEGDKFDASGMKVTATFSDGSTKDVTSAVTYTEQSLKTTDTQITISYKDGDVTKTSTQAITVKAKPVITSVKINPEKITLEQGAEKTFGVDIEGTNASETVEWSISGNKSDATVIDQSGKLTVASDESAETITVTVTSKEDTGKSASAAVTVEKKTEKPENPDNSNKPETPSNPDDSESDTPGEEESENVQLKHEETGITLSGNLSGGAKLTVSKITNELLAGADSNISYEELITTVEDMNILGIYEISLEGTHEGALTLTFKVDEKYEGWNATILHYTEETEATSGDSEEELSEVITIYRETYETAVEDGAITIEVDSLSPFVVAVDEPEQTGSDDENDENNTNSGSGNSSDSNNNSTASENNDDAGKDADGADKAEVKDKSAETGDTFPITAVAIAAAVALLCIIGILVSRKFRKK